MAAPPRAPAGTPSVNAKPVEIAAQPYPFELELAHSALLIIDMQRDFLEPGGFGEALGNDVSLLRSTIAPIRALLGAWRKAGLLAVHTREGHRQDLADLPPSKWKRGNATRRIGDVGPMGRILIRGEDGHDTIPELYPQRGEPIIDKPGKGAFWSTDLHAILQHRQVRQLIVTGVTTEVCVNTTVREANDRGYECLLLEDCCAATKVENHLAAVDMIKMQGGVFGAVASSGALLAALG
mgnify:FL=1